MHRQGLRRGAHPEIDLRVSASAHHVDFAREDIDLAVRHGDGTAAGLHVTRLCAEELFPGLQPEAHQRPQPAARARGPEPLSAVARQ